MGGAPLVAAKHLIVTPARNLMTSSRGNVAKPCAGAADAELALVCVLGPVDRATRLISVRDVLERATGWAVRQDGVILEFPEGEGMVHTLLDFVLAERRCCPHFTYQLCFTPDHQGVTLRMRASGAYLARLKALYRELVGGLAGTESRTNRAAETSGE
jgi:hypothetical protein